MVEMIVIHNLKDPHDPRGRSYKEVNLEKQHRIPIGALVELQGEDGTEDEHYGVRLYVVAHLRDCDGTPLYAMSAYRTDTVEKIKGFANPGWLHGWDEEGLKVIRLPGGSEPRDAAPVDG